MANNARGGQMRVGIVGMGPIGSTLAAHLANAGAFVVACDVDREKIDAVKKDGVLLENKIQKKAKITDVCYSARDLGDYNLDLVVVSVKTPSIKKVVALLSDTLSDKTFIMCAQNWLDNEQDVAAIVGKERTLRLSINFAGGMSSPNTAQVIFFHPPNYVAALTSEGKEVANRFAELLNSVDLQTEIADDIRIHTWKKAILNSALSPVCAITGRTMKSVMEFPPGVEMVKAILTESIQVAEKESITYGDDFLDICLTYLKGGGDHKPSMLVDLENGLLTEIDYLNGRIAEYGHKHGLPTPYNRAITAFVHMLEKTEG
jgi:2-dehydropantoate 2-reductase